MLRKILLIGNVCCLLFFSSYFFLFFPLELYNLSSEAHKILILFIIIILFVLNNSFISKTGNKIKKLQSQVDSLSIFLEECFLTILQKKDEEGAKEMNVKEILLIIGNVGFLLLVFWLYLRTRSFLFLALIIVPLLNIIFIGVTSSVGISLSIERKELEEEIEIQEAKSRLKALQKEEKIIKKKKA